MTINGKAIALTVAGLILSAGPAIAGDAKEAKVRCSGVNACKGQGKCSGANHSCAGQNACKGKGWVEATEKECKDQKGTVVVDKTEKKKDAKK